MGEAKRRKDNLGFLYGLPRATGLISFKFIDQIYGQQLPQSPSGFFTLEASMSECAAKAICMVSVLFDEWCAPEYRLDIVGTKGRWKVKEKNLLPKALAFLHDSSEAQRIEYGMIDNHLYWAETSKTKPNEWELFCQAGEYVEPFKCLERVEAMQLWHLQLPSGQKKYDLAQHA
jgi:hypothetical protein